MATVRKREGKRGVSWQIDYFDPNGKRVRKYKSQLIKVALTFERGKLRISLDISWKKTQRCQPLLPENSIWLSTPRFLR